jgi:iron complex outermembrane receptor protein
LLAPFTGNKHASKVVQKFTVSYKLTDDNLIYGDYSVGFRSGGLSPRSTLSEQVPGQSNYDPNNPNANYSTFNPETDIQYEVGSKNTFFHRQLTVNLSGFITGDHDHQAGEVVVTPGYGPGTNTYIVNLPKVEIKGFEGEIIARPDMLRGFTFLGSFGYEQARVTNGKVPGVEAPLNANGTAGAPGTTYDLTGTTLERVPDWNFSLRGDYTRDIGPGTVDVNLGYVWNDGYVFAYFAGLPDVQRGFGLLDLSISYAWSRYKVIFTGKNLTGEVYYSNTLPSVFFHGWGDPRTVLGEIQVKF